MPTTKLKTIPLKLHAERDADLIRWYESLPAGQRNQRGGRTQTVIAMLRLAVFDVSPVGALPVDEPLALENAVLRAKVEQHERDLLALHERLQAVEQNGVALPRETSAGIEASEKITAKAKAERKGRLLRNEW